MRKRLKHSTLQLSCLAAIGMLLAQLGGCSTWQNERWSLNNLRDQRAVDIDQRLESSSPIVSNPF